MMDTPNDATPRIALALQGGGALGAYQAGVYQALHEHNMEPDWVLGTSIGAINAGIIAGNEPAQRLPRLREFWQSVACRDLIYGPDVPDWVQRVNVWSATVRAIAQGIPGFFAPRIFNPFLAGLPVAADRAGIYDTSPLRATLTELIDTDTINRADGVRLTVNAVQVTNARLTSFDSAQQPVGIDHILASGAIPPSFPPVRIDGELYWDGGIHSNTPFEAVINDLPRTNTLCFMVDLWSPENVEPETLDQVQSRQKEVMYSSRSRRHIEAYGETHNLRRKLKAMYNLLPAELRNDPEIQSLAESCCDKTMHIVRLQYPGHDWKTSSKDINFSRGSIEWRWQRGYDDAARILQQAPWLNPSPPHQGIVLHELTR